MFKDFLGKDDIKIVNKILLNENVFVGSLPGMGQHTFCRGVCELVKLKGFVCIDIFPEINKVENLIEANIVLETEIKDKTNTGIQTLLEKKNTKILVVLHKVKQDKNFETWVAYLETLRKKYFYKVVILATTHYSNINKISLPQGCHKYIFRGFKEKHKELLESLSKYYEVKINQTFVETTYNLTLGHAGLNKSLTFYYKENKKLETPLSMLNYYEDLNNRLKRIFEDILIAKELKLETYGSNKEQENYFNIGLFDGKIYGGLYTEYIKNFFINTQNVAQVLSKTELNIFNIINSNLEYIQVNTIIDKLGGNEHLTDWTIYKHINNINKKLKRTGIKIKNQRSKGYYIVRS